MLLQPSISWSSGVGNWPDLQVYRHSPASQVVHAEYAADDISAQRVEYKDLPYRLASGIQYGRGLGQQAVCVGVVVLVGVLVRGLVQVEDLFDGGFCTGLAWSKLRTRGSCQSLPTCLSLKLW